METEIVEDEVPPIIICHECLSEIDEGDEVTIDTGEISCIECASYCERCCVYLSTDNNDSFTQVGNEQWCYECTCNHAHYCDYCNEYGMEYTHEVSDRSDYYCTDCFEQQTIFCEICEGNFVDGCDDCEPNGNIIHDYSYRPDPIFLTNSPFSSTPSDRLFFGWELEVEARRGNRETRFKAAEYAHQLEGYDLAYLKNDGSLECGFEIVTHPMSHDYAKNHAPKYWEVIDKLRDEMNMRSWDTRTCGLHVHISRAGFSGGAHTHRFLQFIYNNKSPIELLAGRADSHWARFDDNTNREGKKSYKHKLDMRGDSVRYSAVNTLNRRTLEMRMFRGSLNTTRIKSALDLAHASVEYTRVMTVKQVINGMLDFRHFMTWVNEQGDLYSDLIACSKLVGTVQPELQNA